MDKKDIGAMWARTSQKGNPWLSGIIEVDGKKIEFVAFHNDKGGVEKRPDYKIYPSEPMGERKETVPF